MEGPQVLVDPSPPPAPPPPPPPVVATASPPPPDPKSALAARVLSWLKARSGNKWVRWGLFVPFVAVGAFYFRDKRVGNGVFADPPAWAVDLFEGVKAAPGPNGSVVVTYQDGTTAAAPGRAVVVWTAEDNKAMPDRMAAFAGVVKDGDYPLLLFLNASGFDPTGEPVLITRLKDGSTVYASPNAVVPPRLVVAERDGAFTAYNDAGVPEKVTEAEFLKRYMRLGARPEPVHAPKEWEKLTDEELKAKGYERVTPEEYEKRFGKKPPVVRQLSLPQEK